MHKCTKGDDSMAKKRNIIVGQSGGPTSVINSSLAGVYKNAIERGFDKVYGMLHGALYRIAKTYSIGISGIMSFQTSGDSRR